MTVFRTFQNLTDWMCRLCQMSSMSRAVAVVVVLLVSFTDRTSAEGEFCSLFGAECLRLCDVSLRVQVTFDVCDKPLVCCFKSQRQQSADRGLPSPDLTGGQIPFSKQRFQQRQHQQRPFQPYLPTLPPTPPPRPTTTVTNPPPVPPTNYQSNQNQGNYVVPPPNVCGVKGHSRVRRIVNGVKTERCRYPWMVLLDRGPNPWDTCGASLISDRHIITAAHCFGFIPGRPVVVVGEYDKGVMRQGSEVRITDYNITIHPYYDSVQFVHDIAMITLATPLDLSKYECLRPICLPDENEDIPVGANCLVAGWGSVQRDNEFSTVPRTSSVLQETTIQVVRPTLCEKMWANRFHRDFQICAGDMTGYTDSCLGDSGGPLMCPSVADKDVFYLHGVVSLGSAICATPNVPALYTKVGKYRPWIEYMMTRH